MTEEHLVGGAIRIIGLWRIFYSGGNALYFVIVRDLGLKTQAAEPLSVDLQSLIFNLVLGTAMILAAPAMLQMIYGKRAALQPHAER